MAASEDANFYLYLQQFYRISQEALRNETSNPGACPIELLEQCQKFSAAVLKGGQLYAHTNALPLPLTHCEVCWRACNAIPWSWACLAVDQSKGGGGSEGTNASDQSNEGVVGGGGSGCTSASGGGVGTDKPCSKLKRISGAVFRALVRRRPPFCCNAAWHNLDITESYARYNPLQEIMEAPVNPGSNPLFSFVGGSLRVLPVAPLDFITHCWQAWHGYDSKPLFEMTEAMKRLVGRKILSNELACQSLGEKACVVMQAQVLDFSRQFQSCDNTHVVVIMGQLTFCFKIFKEDDQHEVHEVVLPSRHSVLGVLPFCRKGQVPLVRGSLAYLKRRHETRPNVPHVISSKNGIECFISCQDVSGKKKRFIIEARRAEGNGKRAKSLEKGDTPEIRNSHLAFSVRVSNTAIGKEQTSAEILDEVMEGSKNSKKKAGAQNKYVPLMSWVMWFANKYEAVTTWCDLELILTKGLSSALCSEQGFPASEAFVKEFLSCELSIGQAHGTYQPHQDKKIKTSSVLIHVPDKFNLKIGVICSLLAKALLLSLKRGCGSKDNVASTKSMASLVHVWETMVSSSLRGAMTKALRKIVGNPKKKAPEPEGGVVGGGQCNRRYTRYSCNFVSMEEELVQARHSNQKSLLRDCVIVDKNNNFVMEACSSVVLDSYAKFFASSDPEARTLKRMSCRRLSSLADGFYFVLERTPNWGSARCPMCNEESGPASLISFLKEAANFRLGCLPGLKPSSLCCTCCGFKETLSERATKLCCLVPTKQDSRTNIKEEDAPLQRLFFSLLAAMHLSCDFEAYGILCQLLKGKAQNTRSANKNVKRIVGGIIAPGTENSARGIKTKRGRNPPTEISYDLPDGRCDKDSNPGMRIYLRSGSDIQSMPKEDELRYMLIEIWKSSSLYVCKDGTGRLELAGPLLEGWKNPLCVEDKEEHEEEEHQVGDDGAEDEWPLMFRFSPSDLSAVLVLVRIAIHKTAAAFCNPDLVKCCPMLRYSQCGPVVVLLCSGSELVRPVGWRKLTQPEANFLEQVRRGGCPSWTSAFHESWKAIPEKGLSWAMLVYAGVVTFAPEDAYHTIMSSADFHSSDCKGDGQTFYSLSSEMESAISVTQTEREGGHPVRHGYSITLAQNSHRHPPLEHRKGSVSSLGSLGFDPCHANPRGFVGNTPGNFYGGTLKNVALLNSFRSIMQDDSLPEGIDAYRHVKIRHDTLTLKSQYPHCLSDRGYIRPLKEYIMNKHIDGGCADFSEFSAHIDNEFGYVTKPYCFVKKGQALCFVVPGPGLANGKCELLVAPSDLWVKRVNEKHITDPVTGLVAHYYEVEVLIMQTYGIGQKLGKLYQKFVSVLLKNWVGGGRGRATSLLSSSSIASRTAVQNIYLSWMTSLGLATGVGPLDLHTHLDEPSACFRDAHHRSKPLSASSLTELRLRTPGVSVSNKGPLVCGRMGRQLGYYVQLMTSMCVAAQDATKPNGSINGIKESGKPSPGSICLDPIMTDFIRELGLEQQECVVDEKPLLSCQNPSCLKLLGNGPCNCPSGTVKTPCILNPSFVKAASILACINIDVQVKCAKSNDPSDSKHGLVPPESSRWSAVPPRPPHLSMLDPRLAQDSHRRRQDEVVCSAVIVESQQLGLSFGSSSTGDVLANMFVASMRSLGRQAVWESGDTSRGHTVLAQGDFSTFAEAFELASLNVSSTLNLLEGFKKGGKELAIDSLVTLDTKVSHLPEGEHMSLGLEVGGRLYIHTQGEYLKQAMIGITTFGNTCERVFRAFLVSPPSTVPRGGASEEGFSIKLLPLENKNYSPYSLCEERVRRMEFERNFDYINISQTLSKLPLCRKFHSHCSVVNAVLKLDKQMFELRASQICVNGEPLFFKDVILSANPLPRGWCVWEEIHFKFVLCHARVELRHQTNWESFEELARTLEGSQPSGASHDEIIAKIDIAATSKIPPLVMPDQAPVYEVSVRDLEDLDLMDPNVCGYGVFDRKHDLKTSSQMYCVNCEDCMRYFQKQQQHKTISNNSIFQKKEDNQTKTSGTIQWPNKESRLSLRILRLALEIQVNISTASIRAIGKGPSPKGLTESRCM